MVNMKQYIGIGIEKSTGEIHFRTKDTYPTITEAMNKISDWINIGYTQIADDYRVSFEEYDEENCVCLPIQEEFKSKRNFLTSIDTSWRDGDRICLKRPENPYNGIHEPCHKEAWLDMLKGYIKDIEKEIQEIEKEYEE